MARNKGNFNFAANFQVKVQEALDPRVVVSEKTDLIKVETWPSDGDTLYLYEGLIVGVSKEQSAYMLTDLTKVTEADYSGWKRIDSGVEIDSTLSLVSEKPVQNKVVTAAIQAERDRATEVESGLQKLIQDQGVNLENIDARIADIEDRLSKVETGEGSAILTKVDENTEAIEILNGDETVVGSIDYKIKQAVEWAALNN